MTQKTLSHIKCTEPANLRAPRRIYTVCHPRGRSIETIDICFVHILYRTPPHHRSMPHYFDQTTTSIATTAAIYALLLLYQNNNRISLLVNGQSASYPTLRFIPWDQNDESTISVAIDALGYNSTSWDNPGTNPIEMLTFEMITIDLAVAAALEQLDLDKHSWDCYINHYRGYTWPDLTNTYKNAYRTLGWTHVSWNQRSDPPESERWDELNASERDAAEILCYFDNLWNAVPISEWNDETNTRAPTTTTTTLVVPSTSPTSTTTTTSIPSSTPSSTPRSYSWNLSNTVTPSPSWSPSRPPSVTTTSMPSFRLVVSPASIWPTIVATTQLTIPIPYFRYIQWSKLNDDTRILATLLGYTPETWDMPGRAAIEHQSFDMIRTTTASHKMDHQSSKQIVFLQALGFGKPSWDCFITHYRPYDWEQLEEYGVQSYYETLGWTEPLWNSSRHSNDGNSSNNTYTTVPRTEGLLWNELNVSERIAAESLCYLEPIWNQVTLQNEVVWRTNPSSSSSSSNVVEAFSWTSICAILTMCVVSLYTPRTKLDDLH